MVLRPVTSQLAGIVIAFTACAADESVPPSMTVRDSMGVTIVENHEPAWLPSEAWRIADTATLQIGLTDGPPEYTFGSPAALQLSDGRTLVADSDYKELRYFDANGTYLNTVGGEGPGPGEFTWLGPTFVLPGDTVIASDHSSGRVSVFDESGMLVETVQLESRGNQTKVAGPLAAWSWVATATFPAPDSAGLSGQLQEIAVYGSDGDVTALIDTVTLFRRVTRQSDAGVLMTVLPFGPRPSVTAANGKAYVTPGDRYEIGVYDSEGRLVRIIRRDWDPQPVTNEDIAEHLEHVKSMFERFDTPASTREAFLAMNELAARLTDVKPPIRALVIDREGNLWVERWVVGWRTVGKIPVTPYDVFDPKGMWLGEVEVPRGHWITDIGPDYAWTVWADEYDVNYVRRLKLVKPSL